MGLLATLSTGAPPSVTGRSGRVYGVNGIDRPFVWDTLAGYRNWGMDAPPANTLGAVSGVGLTGAYSWRVTWYNSVTDEYGASTAPLSATLANQGQTVNRPSIAGIDPQVTHWRLWRTIAGEGSTYYLQGTYTKATTSTVDNTSDEVVGSSEVWEDHSPPLGKYRWAEEFKGRLYVYGSRIESTGTVTCANGSPNVTGAGTQFTQAMKDQKFYFAADTVVYTVLSVTDATHLVLTANKVGAVAGVVYRITAEDPAAFAWSFGGSESFDPASAYDVFPNDGDFPSGMKRIGGSLIFWKRAHAYAYDFAGDPDPSTTAVLQPALAGRGLVRHECCVVVGPTAYCLDSIGPYIFDGGSQVVEIDQGIRRMFHPDEGTPAEERINRAYSSTWHGEHDPKTNCIVWFVTSGSEAFPQTELCWQLDRQRWTVNRKPMPMMASTRCVDDAGEYRLVVTDALDAGPWAYSGTRGLDGTTHGTIAGTATAGGASTLTDAGAAFWTTGVGLKGVPVSIIGGAGRGQTRIIASNTATVLTTSAAWTTQPDATSVYRVGAMETRSKYVWQSFDAGSRQAAQACRVYYEPTATDRTLSVRFFKDFEADPITAWDPRGLEDGFEVTPQALVDGFLDIHTNFLGGRVAIELPINAQRVFQIEVRQLDANAPIMFLGCDLEGRPAATIRDK